MTTPTPRTDAAQNHGCWTDDTVFYVPADFARQLERELAEARASVENYATAAEELRQELNEQASRLAKRDALIQLILDYPYLPQNLATIIRKEMEK